MPRLPRDEFGSAVYAPQLEHVVADRGFGQYGEVASRGYGYRHLDDRHAHDFLAARPQRQAVERGEIPARTLEVHDDLQVLARAQRRLAEYRADVEHAQAPHLQKIPEELGAA